MPSDTSPTRERDHDTEDQPSERTPLLPASDENPNATSQSQPQHETSASSALERNLNGKDEKPTKRRWPSLLALVLLCLVAILIMVFAFMTPSVVQEYAQQAVVFEPTSLSIDSFTATGVKARVQGDFSMDGSRVQKKSVRDLGRFGTWIAREVQSGESKVEVSLPEYGNVVLGTADVPPIKVSIRDGHTTHVDFVTDLQPGDLDGVRRIANDWIEGRLGQLRVVGKADVPLKSGIFNLGTQSVVQELLFANKDIPAIPSYKIQRLNVRESETGQGMAADVLLRVGNDYPVEFTIPPLAFSILVDNCLPTDPHIRLGSALTDPLEIHPKEDVELNVTGTVRHLPSPLTQACPHSNESPLDAIVGQYMHGKDTTIYVQGSDSPSLDTPGWITDLISDITVPVSLPGRTFGHLIKNFSLTDTHFGLPDPFAEPDTPESDPSISAKVQALIALPEEMNFNISVGRVRADADVFFKGRKLGKLDLHKWQQANSTRVDPVKYGEEGPTLLVESLIKDAPLRITDDDVFTEVLQALLFGGKAVRAQIKAEVDVEVETALGAFAIRKVPAEGEVPIQPISRPGSGGGLSDGFKPAIFDLNIVDTNSTALTISALVNVSNPTVYSATIPFVDIHILVNGTLLGHAIAKDLNIKPGNNTNMLATAIWDPRGLSGAEGGAVGREFLSQYITGYNTTLTLQMHENSFPSTPSLGRALSRFSVEMPTPRLGSDTPKPPSDPDYPSNPDPSDGPKFMKDGTMHLLTSTATFILLSPLRHSTLYITSINATAFYHEDAVGHIEYDLPFAVEPVDDEGQGTLSPRLPVDWELGGAGFDAVRKALGGRLKLRAEAEVGVMLGEWGETVWFKGDGIGAKIRL